MRVCVSVCVSASVSSAINATNFTSKHTDADEDDLVMKKIIMMVMKMTIMMM